MTGLQKLLPLLSKPLTEQQLEAEEEEEEEEAAEGGGGVGGGKISTPPAVLIGENSCTGSGIIGEVDLTNGVMPVKRTPTDLWSTRIHKTIAIFLVFSLNCLLSILNPPIIAEFIGLAQITSKKVPLDVLKMM